MSDLPLVNVQAAPDLRSAVEELLPRLGARGVERVEVFQYNRPGEERFWLAFLFTASGRSVLGTPDMRQLSLEEQQVDLLRQLANFDQSSERRCDGGDA